MLCAVAKGSDVLGCCWPVQVPTEEVGTSKGHRRRLHLCHLCRAGDHNTWDVAAWWDGRLLRSSTVRPLVHKVDFLANIETCWQMAAAGLRSSAPVWRGVAGRAGFSQTPPAEMGLVHPRLKVPRWGGNCWLSRLLSFSWQSNYLLNCDPISKGLRRRLLVGHHIRSVLRGTPKDAQRIEVEQKWGKQRKMLTYETSRTDWCLKEDENTELVLRFG